MGRKRQSLQAVARSSRDRGRRLKRTPSVCPFHGATTKPFRTVAGTVLLFFVVQCQAVLPKPAKSGRQWAVASNIQAWGSSRWKLWVRLRRQRGGLARAEFSALAQEETSRLQEYLVCRVCNPLVAARAAATAARIPALPLTHRRRHRSPAPETLPRHQSPPGVRPHLVRRAHIGAHCSAAFWYRQQCRCCANHGGQGCSGG